MEVLFAAVLFAAAQLSSVSAMGPATQALQSHVERSQSHVAASACDHSRKDAVTQGADSDAADLADVAIQADLAAAVQLDAPGHKHSTHNKDCKHNKGIKQGTKTTANTQDCCQGKDADCCEDGKDCCQSHEDCCDDAGGCEHAPTAHA